MMPFLFQKLNKLPKATKYYKFPVAPLSKRGAAGLRNVYFGHGGFG